MVRDTKSFLDYLEARVRERRAQVASNAVTWFQRPMNVQECISWMQTLRYAMLRTVDIRASWIPEVPDIDVKIGLAKQVWDEGRHSQLIAQRIRDLGGDPDDYEPSPEWAAYFDFYTTLEEIVERFAACNFTGEANARASMLRFAELADPETRRMFLEQVAPDEIQHHELGRMVLERYCSTEDQQQRALAAALRQEDNRDRAVSRYNQSR